MDIGGNLTKDTNEGYIPLFNLIKEPPMTSQELLDLVREMLSYDPETGDIFWRKSPSKNVYAGEIAGCVKATRKNASGADVSYRYIRLHGMNIPAQRIAYALHHGDFPESRISFVDGDPLNLRAGNLSTQRALQAKRDVAEQHEYLREHRKQHRLSYSESDMNRKYGITLQEYAQRIVDQNGVCAICKQPETHMRNGKLKALAVDHDHKTGAVRGLLCSDCNTGIGKLKDDPEIMKSAIRYLQLGTSIAPTGPADAAQDGATLVQKDIYT